MCARVCVCVCVCGHNIFRINHCPEHFRVTALDVSKLSMASGLLHSSKVEPLLGGKEREATLLQPANKSHHIQQKTKVKRVRDQDSLEQP